MYELKSFPFINGLVCVLKNELKGAGEYLSFNQYFNPIKRPHGNHSRLSTYIDQQKAVQ
jgi:hypothetical protein